MEKAYTAKAVHKVAGGWINRDGASLHDSGERSFGDPITLSKGQSSQVPGSRFGPRPAGFMMGDPGSDALSSRCIYVSSECQKARPGLVLPHRSCRAVRAPGATLVSTSKWSPPLSEASVVPATSLGDSSRILWELCFSIRPMSSEPSAAIEHGIECPGRLVQGYRPRTALQRSRSPAAMQVAQFAAALQSFPRRVARLAGLR